MSHDHSARVWFDYLKSLSLRSMTFIFHLAQLHRSIRPTVSLIRSTNGFSFSHVPFRNCFEFVFAMPSFPQTLRRNEIDIIFDWDTGQWGTLVRLFIQ